MDTENSTAHYNDVRTATNDDTSSHSLDPIGIAIIEVVLILLIGILNGLVIIACTLSKPLRTTTHRYIQSMAVFDILKMFGIATDMYTVIAWTDDSHYRTMCVTKIIISIFSGLGSIVTVCAVALTRFAAVKFPHHQINRQSPVGFILAIWIYVIILCFVIHPTFGTEQIIEKPCTLVSINKPFMNRILFSHPIVIAVICIICYAEISHSLFKNSRKRNLGNKHFARTKETRLTAIMFVVTTVFIACWTPLTLTILTARDARPHLTVGWKIMTNLTNVYAFLNPVVYVLIMRDFRAYLRTLFCFKNNGRSSSDNGRSPDNQDDRSQIGTYSVTRNLELQPNAKNSTQSRETLVTRCPTTSK